MGTDEYGKLIQQHLEKANVNLPQGFADKRRTSTATVPLEPQGVASYTFDLNWEIKVPGISGAAIVHTGPIGAVLEPGGAAVGATMSSAGPSDLRTHDPIIRADIMGEPSSVRGPVYELATSCHVVKLSDEDVAWITRSRRLSPAEVLQRIADSDPRFTVLTTGEHGCIAIADGRTHHLPARPVELVDTIGAGDVFMSGLIFALSQGGLG